MKVAFLGLGVMGFPMAGHLAASGHEVAVFNRTPARAQAWLERHNGIAAPRPEEAAAGAEVVFACVGEDRDIAEVARAAFGGMSPGALFVDHTTASCEIARILAEEARARGLGFIDAPVSGGEAGAQAGQLAIMCGGQEADIVRARPVMEAYAKAVTHIGPVGAGQLAKMVNQICIAGIVQGLAEGLHFARASGVDAARVLEAISGGAAQSWQMDNRAATMVQGEFDFGFAVDWMRKDLAICLAEARRAGARLPLTALVDQFYGDIQAVGGGRWDTSSLIARLNQCDDEEKS